MLVVQTRLHLFSVSARNMLLNGTV